MKGCKIFTHHACCGKNFRTNTYILYYNSQNKVEIIHKQWDMKNLWPSDTGQHIKSTIKKTSGMSW